MDKEEAGEVKQKTRGGHGGDKGGMEQLSISLQPANTPMQTQTQRVYREHRDY